ncbi:coiled-coil domain-containing protein 154 [Loxodonta africana]|uniref:coiled-coil domain-containing protein 154 n=1 Tax=Loxodonta africana TaxID=9785 RepID=UPI000C810B44|nr:coiled-coil domain-containing protein 154 [Loxodonta africana]
MSRASVPELSGALEAPRASGDVISAAVATGGPLRTLLLSAQLAWAAQIFGLVWARPPLRFTFREGCDLELTPSWGHHPVGHCIAVPTLAGHVWLLEGLAEAAVKSCQYPHVAPFLLPALGAIQQFRPRPSLARGDLSFGAQVQPCECHCIVRSLIHGGLPCAVLVDFNSIPSPGASTPSWLSPATLEDLGLIFGDDPASLKPLSLEEISKKCESGCLAPTSPVPGQDTPKHWRQLEQWLVDLQAKVACLWGHRDRCSCTTPGLLQELLQLRALVELQDTELKQLQQDVRQAARAPEKEACELASTPSQIQMQALDKRLVEVREALAQIRRKQVLQDSKHKSSDQELTLRLSKLTGKLRQEGQDWKVACGTLQKKQEEASQRVEREVAKMQAQVTKLGEEMSLRFLKREAKLCGFLQKSFLALEKKMKTAEDARLQAEVGLWEELESRWQKLQEKNEELLLVLRGQREEEESCLLDQCRGLDRSVVQLTKFLTQNQMSLNHVLQAGDAKGLVEKSQAGELTTYLQENLEAMRLAGKLAQQEACSTLELLREKSQALEASAAELARQVKDLSDHFMALSWRLDLHEQTLNLRLSEVKSEREGAERKSLEDLARWQQEAEAHLREVREKVDSLPRQIEGVSAKCILHKSESDLKITSEGKTREFEVGAVRQELAALLLSVQLLKKDHSGRKIAEIQGKLATFQNQIMKLENSLHDNKTIQSLKFNTETKLRVEEIAMLRESVMRLWSEEGPWALKMGSRRVLMSLVRQHFFVKDTTLGEVASVNQWGVYQATRWLQWKVVLMSLVPQRRPNVAAEKFCSLESTSSLPSLSFPPK